VNDAAAAQLGITATAASHSKELDDRRETGIELLRVPAAPPLSRNASPRPGQAGFSHDPSAGSDRRPHLLLSSSADISEQKAVEDQLFRSAYYDELTDLPTRRVIEHRANSLLQRDGPSARFALAFLDIDNFKHINDYYGHGAGDTLLIEVAKRLGLDLRDSDMLSRISGDEFLLLLNPIQSEQEVAEYIHFTLQRLKAPFFIDGSEIFASTSIGVSLYPEHGRSYEVAPERRHRDVPRQERRQGRRGVLRRQHGTRGAGAHEDRAVAAARHSGKALLLRLPGQGRHPDPGDQGHRGAGAAARRRGRDPGSRHLHQSRGRTRADRRA
jgi:cyclic di-GMP phosphodiesterase Gmr